MKHNPSQNQLLIFTLLEAAGRVERRLDSTLSLTRGISFREYHLLRSLADLYDGTAARVDLAAAVGLTPSAVTRALKPLEKLGYVRTHKSERDARRSLAELTSGGRELLADAQLAVDDVVAELSPQDIDRRQVAGFLDGLARK